MASVCRSLQCLPLIQAGGGSLLFRFACSFLLWGGRGAAGKCHWPVWGALAVFRPHWVCPRLGRVPVLSPSTLLRVQAALQGVGPALRGLPRPNLLRFRFSDTPQRCRLCWTCVLCLPQLEQIRQPGTRQAHSPALSPGMVHLSPPRSQPQFPCTPVGCTLCLFWGAGL